MLPNDIREAIDATKNPKLKDYYPHSQAKELIMRDLGVLFLPEPLVNALWACTYSGDNYLSKEGQALVKRAVWPYGNQNKRFRPFSQIRKMLGDEKT